MNIMDLQLQQMERQILKGPSRVQVPTTIISCLAI